MNLQELRLLAKSTEHRGDDCGRLARAILDAVGPDTLTEAVEPLETMRARKDAAYYERSQVVAALARCFPSGIARTAIAGWAEDWHGTVYIDLPTGQVSWHYRDSHAHLFAGLPPYTKPWDGHDTPEKYRRLAALTGPWRHNSEGPLDKFVLMLWRPIDHEARPLHREVVVGQFSSFQDGKTWVEGRYIDTATHILGWMPLPPKEAPNPYRNADLYGADPSPKEVAP